MVKITKTSDNSCWWWREVRRTLIHWECKFGQPLWKSVWQFLRKLGTDQPRDPSTLHLVIYPKHSTSYYRDTYLTIFIATLFIIARNWKQPRWPSTEEWIKKMWCIHTMDYCSATKTEIIKLACKWIQLEKKIQSEITQTQKDKYVMYLLICRH